MMRTASLLQQHNDANCIQLHLHIFLRRSPGNSPQILSPGSSVASKFAIFYKPEWGWQDLACLQLLKSISKTFFATVKSFKPIRSLHLMKFYDITIKKSRKVNTFHPKRRASFQLYWCSRNYLISFQLCMLWIKSVFLCMYKCCYKTQHLADSLWGPL